MKVRPRSTRQGLKPQVKKAPLAPGFEGARWLADLSGKIFNTAPCAAGWKVPRRAGPHRSPSLQKRPERRPNVPRTPVFASPGTHERCRERPGSLTIPAECEPHVREHRHRMQPKRDEFRPSVSDMLE